MNRDSAREVLGAWVKRGKEVYAGNKQKAWIAGGVIGLVILGATLRLWGMPGAMLYSLDQARDYRVAALVLDEGIGSLPLLGARAGGTDFRLGPIHNYFHLPGLWLTGIQEPYGILLVEVLCSIALIVLVYVFMRALFSRVVSLLVTAHVAVGIIFVSLARFTWNPNTTPFFITVLILAGWSLLHTEREKKWRLAAAAAFGATGAILMQLHTIAFVIVPLTMIIWQVRFRLLRSVGEWAMAIVLIALIFLPVLLSEYLTNWALTKAFFIEGGGRIDSWLEMLKSAYKMMYDLVWYFTMMFTGYHPLPHIARLESAKNMRAVVGFNKELSAVLVLGFVLLTGTWVMLWRWVRTLTGIARARWQMLGILILLSLVIITPLSLKASDTRYFHVIYFFPLLTYAFVLTWVLKQKYVRWIGYLGAAGLLVSSLLVTWQFVSVTSKYQSEYHPDFEIEALESYYVTNMEQYEMVSDYIASTLQSKGKQFLYLEAPTHEERALSVTLRYRHNVARTPFLKEALNPDGMYVLVRRTEEIYKGKKLTKKYRERFDVVEERSFGTLTVLIFTPKADQVLVPLTDAQESAMIEEFDYDTPFCEADINARCRLKDILR